MVQAAVPATVQPVNAQKPSSATHKRLNESNKRAARKRSSKKALTGASHTKDGAAPLQQLLEDYISQLQVEKPSVKDKTKISTGELLKRSS